MGVKEEFVKGFLDHLPGEWDRSEHSANRMLAEAIAAGLEAVHTGEVHFHLAPNHTASKIGEMVHISPQAPTTITGLDMQVVQPFSHSDDQVGARELPDTDQVVAVCDPTIPAEQKQGPAAKACACTAAGALSGAVSIFSTSLEVR